MNFDKDINLPSRTLDISVDGEGEVDIDVQSGYEVVTVSFELEELREMLKQAEAHKTAYDAFKANDYEDIVMPEIGDKVKPDWGRNAGKAGTVVSVKPEDLSVLIDFGGFVTTEDGFKMEDRYWSSIKKIETKGE